MLWNEPLYLWLYPADLVPLLLPQAGLLVWTRRLAVGPGRLRRPGRSIDWEARRSHGGWIRPDGVARRGSARYVSLNSSSRNDTGVTMDTLRIALDMSRSHPRQRSYIDVDTCTGRSDTTPLQGALSLLRAILESTADGILAVDLQGMILCFNRRFLEMWRIPDHVLSLREDASSLVFVLDQLQDPDGFVTKVHELYAQPLADSVDVLKFKDGRVFERYSRPQCIEGTPVARVWIFRDVTDRAPIGA